MMQLLHLVIHMDAKQAQQAREIINARLRELAFDEACINVYEGITKDTPSPKATAHLPEDVRNFNASEDDRLGHFDVPDGVELQAGLEEALRRQNGSKT